MRRITCTCICSTYGHLYETCSRMFNMLSNSQNVHCICTCVYDVRIVNTFACKYVEFRNISSGCMIFNDDWEVALQQTINSTNNKTLAR